MSDQPETERNRNQPTESGELSPLALGSLLVALLAVSAVMVAVLVRSGDTWSAQQSGNWAAVSDDPNGNGGSGFGSVQVGTGALASGAPVTGASASPSGMPTGLTRLTDADRPLVVEGDQTLETLAAAVGDSSQFGYDPLSRLAVCNRDLLIRGRLRIGQPHQPESAQTLQMNTLACGGLNIRVEPTGELALHHSTLTTVAQIIANGACPQGYGLSVAGKLVLDNANLDYMSGSVSESLLPGAWADVQGSSVTRGDGHCFKIREPDNARIRLEGSTLAVNADWAMTVFGPNRDDQPLKIRNCTFRAHAGQLTLAERDVRVDLEDCRLGGPPKFVFNNTQGDSQVRVRWSVEVRLRAEPTHVLDYRTLTVSATTSNPQTPSGGLREVQWAHPNSEGIVRLTLTEWTATPRAPQPSAFNRSGPHLITVKTAKGEVLAETTVDLRGTGHRVVLAIPTTPLPPG